MPNSVKNGCALIILALCLVACRVEHTDAMPASAELAALPTFTPTEVVRLGGAGTSEPELFGRVARVLVGPDSLVYVLDTQRAEVLVFDRAGGFVRRIGRKGPGPGEFSGVSDMGFVGDTLWVQDWVRRVDALFTLGGHFVHNVAATLAVDTARFPGPSLPLALLEARHAVFEPTNPPPTLAPDAVAPVVLVDLVTSRRDTLATRALWRDRIPIPRLGTLRAPGIGDYPLLAIDGLGRRVVVAERGVPATGDSSSVVRVRVWGARGELMVSIALPPFQTRELPAAVRDSIVGGAVAALRRTMAQLPEVRSRIDDPHAVIEAALRLPAMTPPVDALRVTRDGRVWLRLTRFGPGPQDWLVLDASGMPREHVQLPPGFELHDANGSRLWGVEADSLDVQYVVGLALPST